MHSYELVTRAIEFAAPERVPLLFRTDAQRSDVVCIGHSAPEDWAPSQPDEDEWGCVWANIIGTGVGQITRHPLENDRNLGPYRFPDPHAPGRFDGVRDAVKSFEGKYVTGDLGATGFTRLMSLRGFENILMDIAMPDEFLTELMDRVWDYEAGTVQHYAECGVHGIWFFDDWGTENALFVRPSVWREVFKPRYAAQFRMIHDFGMRVLFHSCGYVWDIIPDLIEAGVDVLNLEQPDVFAADGISGIDRLANCFGGKVTFCTNPDSQRMLANGTPAQIEEEVRHIISEFSEFGGGLIPLADCGKDHNILPPENIAAMEAAFIRFR